MGVGRTMFRTFPSRFAAAVASTATRVRSVLRNACRPSGVTGGFMADLTRSRAELIAESALLRQQLIVASRGVKRPRFPAVRRAFERARRDAVGGQSQLLPDAAVG